MSRRWVGALTLFLVLTTGLLAQDQPFRIKVDVALVTIDAIVKDNSGHVVPDLAQTEFQIYDDGRPQEIAYFATSETPRSILLLFDLSGSTNQQRPFMVQACNSFLGLMRPFDRVAIASFAGSFQMLMNWRAMVEGKPKDVTMPAVQFSSNVYPSIETAIEHFKNEKGRKGMVVMTDGRDTSFFNAVQASQSFPAPEADKGFQKFLQIVKRAGIPLYFIAINTDRNHESFGFEDMEYTTIAGKLGKPSGEKYLVAVRSRMESLAEATGGRIL